MAKKTGKRTSRSAASLLRRAASSLAGALSRRGSRKTQEAAAEPAGNGSTGTQQPRRTRRQPDIPLDRLANEYTPTQTSLKAGFRASGDDRERDQEFAGGYADDRWSDEDHYTNRSGDPRIGTHGRTYEPGEK